VGSARRAGGGGAAAVVSVLHEAQALFNQGRFDEATALCRKRVTSNPKDATALHLLGAVQWKQGRPRDAADTLRRAAAASPASADIQTLLGIIFQEQHESEKAVRHFERAYALAPTPASAGNLGYALVLAERDLEQAERLLRAATAAGGLGPQPHRNLAHLLMGWGRLEEAEREARAALALDPAFPEAAITLFQILRRRGRVAESLPAFETALRHAPGDAETHWNKAIAHLLLGDFEEGWREAEWRFSASGYAASVFPFPRWDGAAAPDATLLVHHEQGFGDTLQFVRYLPRLRGRVGRVVLTCQEPLAGLLEGVEGADQVVVARTDRPIDVEADLQVALLSLPGLVGAHLDDIPPPPGLTVLPAIRSRWAERVGQGRELRVGVCWQGNPDVRGDRYRSMPLDLLEPLAGVPGVRLLSLHKGVGQAHLAASPLRDRIEDLGGELADFTDTAAALQSLDLFISTDTAVLHLAGTLGVPTWGMLFVDADWRWLDGRDDSPWYPSMTLFRQERPGDWGGVVARVRQALAERAGVLTSR